jgi:hypothetical protein
MTDHQPDDDDLDPILDAIGQAVLDTRHEPAADAPPELAAALVAAVEAEGCDPGAGRFVWRTTTTVVHDVDGILAGLVETRRLAITNIPPGRP